MLMRGWVEPYWWMVGTGRENRMETFGKNWPTPTGTCDMVTKTWIAMYQMRGIGGLDTIDGRVDPMIPDQSPHRSILLRLNFDLHWARYGDIPKSDAPDVLIEA